MMVTTACLHTVHGISVTPFDEKGAIDFAGLERNLSFLEKAGLRVVVACGNTSEFFSLTLKECELIVTATCRQLAGKMTVVAGVGHDLATAQEMARHAKGAGCDAVMVHYPSHPFVSSDGYRRYLFGIAETAEIPVIAYLRGENIADETVLDIAGHEQVIAIKYAMNNLPRFGTVVARTPADADVAWICGTAESWAPYFFAAGAVGFTSGLVNVAPELSLDLLRALQASDANHVRRLWALIKPFEDLRAENQNAKNVSVVKEAMHQLHLGTRWVRPPIEPLGELDRQRVSRLLQSWKAASVSSDADSRVL
jgi:4-hydroxy-tetrahydrodipicolinate synthase